MKADADEQGDQQMSEAQLTTLGKMKAWYEEGLASLGQFNTDVEKYDEHVPNSVKTRLGEAKETVDLALAELNVAIEQAACGKAEFAQLGQNHKETKKEFAAVETKLKALLKDVKPKEDTVGANPDTKTKKPSKRICKKTKKS